MRCITVRFANVLDNNGSAELFHGREPPPPTGFPGLLMATRRTADPAVVGRTAEEIASACRGGEHKLAFTLLGLVPAFEHNAEGGAGSGHG
jgi:hypothetical protein